MIRPLQNTDLDIVAYIWLDTNLKAHCFIPASYWENNYTTVKEMLPATEVYVYEQDEEILGFIGLSGEHIEGIFVSAAIQSQGIGKELLTFAKQNRDILTLNVYCRNERAVAFYRREGFQILREGFDDETGERDYIMVWKP